jgi:uncharacterized protein
MPWKESSYNIGVELRNGRRLLYNSLSRSTCILEQEDVALLAQVGRGVMSDIGRDATDIEPLVQQGFVTSSELDELAVVRNLYEGTRFNPATMSLTICPTLACNFGCDYCFQGKDKSTELMSEEVQDGIVTLLRRSFAESPETSFVQFMWYGGEPLLKRKVIYALSERLAEVCRESGVNYNAAMVSNGHHLTKEVAEQLYGLGLRTVQITLDGPQQHHDGRRHLLNGKGTYSTIVSNIHQWIDTIPIHVMLRVNIDERNKADITTLIDDLDARGFAGKANFKMYFAPVESVTLGCHSISEKMLKKMDYGRLEADLYRYAFDRGLADIPYPPQFMGICNALRPRDFIVVPCGSIHKCWDTVSFADKKVGSVFELDRLFGKTHPQQQKWDRFDPFKNDTCRNCKILPNCASFCAHKFIHAKDTLGEASLPCPSLKYSIKEKLILIAEKRGHITKDDYDPLAIRTDPKELCSEQFDKAKYVEEYG